MKIALGMKLTTGPFGGGNQFGNFVSQYLKNKGVEVIDHLNDDDIDIIVLTDPRTYLMSNAFGVSEIINYVRKNNNVILVHRINECDERKGTKNVNKQLSNANSYMDHTIFIASWLPPLFEKGGYKFTKDRSFALNGADESIFQPDKNKGSFIEEDRKIRIVTHHWGASRLKGWEIYEHLDNMISEDEFSNIEFHYIGNAPKELKTKNIIFHKPCNGEELAKKIAFCDIYLTASLNEPAGMHHIEGAMCGLPLLYINSGALPEYCDGYGVMFEGKDDFNQALKNIISDYQAHLQKIKEYNNTANVMAQNYLEIFKSLYAKKDEIVSRRNKSIFTVYNSLKNKISCLAHQRFLAE